MPLALKGTLGIATLVIALAVLTAWHFNHARADSPSQALGPVLPAHIPVPASLEASPGPWGELELSRFLFTQSDEFLPPVPPGFCDPKWFFPNFTIRQAQDLFNACELTDKHKALLLTPSIYQQISNGCFVSPPPEVLLNMSAAARQRIYATLAQADFTSSHFYSFQFEPGDFAERFATSGLSPDKLAIINQMTFTNAGLVCLADLDVLRHVLTANDMKIVLKTIHLSRCLLVKLRITPQSDVNALVHYWGQGGTKALVKPLLESLAKSPTTEVLSIALLLPPVPRSRLYVFPHSSTQTNKLREDCVWAALNFFNDPPDDRVLDPDYASQILRHDFKMTREAPAYGDLIVLFDGTGRLVHACVYIADNIVFTKNGMDAMQPYVLMKIPDMLAIFRSIAQSRPAVLRRLSPEQKLAKVQKALCPDGTKP